MGAWSPIAVFPVSFGVPVPSSRPPARNRYGITRGRPEWSLDPSGLWCGLEVR